MTPKQSKNSSILIIGGGLAGLSAATRLAEGNVPISLLEKNNYLGGRAASFVDRTTGDLVDHGQHLMMGVYAETERFLRRIDTFDRISVQERMEITFLHPTKGESALRCPDWPAPLHLFKGLMGLRHLGLRDKLSMLLIGSACLFLNPDKNPSLDNMTVAELLTRYRQTATSQREFWNILTVSVLNEKPDVASAALLLKVFREAFMSHPDKGKTWLSRTGLGELYGPAAVQYIIACGGQVQLSQAVRQLHFSDDRVQTVELKTGECLLPDVVICAVSPFALKLMLSDDDQERYFPYLTYFEPSSIVGVNLWWDRPIMDKTFVGLIDSPIEWVFDKSKVYDPSLAQGTHLALVISGANEYNKMSKDEIITLAEAEIRQFFPSAKNAKLTHGTVFKSKQATFSQRTGMAVHRPPTETRFGNFCLAGDWTSTGFPATIEGAVLSGHRAADFVLRDS